jgi:hypothetical protein
MMRVYNNNEWDNEWFGEDVTMLFDDMSGCESSGESSILCEEIQ